MGAENCHGGSAKRFLKQQKRCNQCGNIFKGTDDYCNNCSDTIFSKFKENDQNHQSDHF